MEAMQWILRYLSIGKDECYWEQLAWHGYNVMENHHA
jgi:hypothetical protein